MQPRSEWNQRCLRFDLLPLPKAKTFSYRDHLGNLVHHFDMPARHSQLRVTADSVVEVSAAAPLPEAVAEETWDEVDKLSQDGTYWDWLVPSDFARPTNLLQSLAGELEIKRRADPLSLLREINNAIHIKFEYQPQSTRVDSPIDEALAARKGVCQDFAHIMIALVRASASHAVTSADTCITGKRTPIDLQPTRPMRGLKQWCPGSGGSASIRPII